MIEIKCKAENFKLVPIEQIVPNPKNNNRHSIEQINAIAKLIKAHGFREPLTISNRSGFLNCGHARLEAATNLGMKEVPVIYQDFASEAEEYQHMTADNEIARWAELDYQGVYDALKEIPDIDTNLLGIEDFKLPGEDEENIYSTKIEIPIYEPKGEKPNPYELYDLQKTTELLEEIHDADIPEDVRLFLELSANRHTVFDYQKIAEFYCHADEKVKDLMERSALVIIDYNKAIENCFVQMTKEIAELSHE